MDYNYDHYKYEAEERLQRAKHRRKAREANKEHEPFIPRRRRR